MKRLVILCAMTLAIGLLIGFYAQSILGEQRCKAEMLSQREDIFIKYVQRSSLLGLDKDRVYLLLGPPNITNPSRTDWTVGWSIGRFAEADEWFSYEKCFVVDFGVGNVVVESKIIERD